MFTEFRILKEKKKIPDFWHMYEKTYLLASSQSHNKKITCIPKTTVNTALKKEGGGRKQLFLCEIIALISVYHSYKDY